MERVTHAIAQDDQRFGIHPKPSAGSQPAPPPHLTALQANATAGDAEAQFSLGLLSLSGRGEAPPPTVVDPTVERMPDGTEHILVVEDDPTVRRLSKELLVRLGYSVTDASSGRAGLALGSDDTRHFDLALCDVIRGDISGPAVAEALRALRPSIRVLYMSGDTDEAIVKTGVLDEGKPFLQKPFTPMQLAKKIREVLDQPETGS
ncbi:MAG: response regulator [Acidobacteria bacterium]|nr:response regulator [Acidobacteriota bacterium]